MGLRFESNYNYFSPLQPYYPADSDPLQRWWRVHEWNVDEGFTGNLLMIMINVEPNIPMPATVDYGYARVKAMLDPTSKSWTTKFETHIQGALMTAKQFTPRLVIIPTGSGIPFTAGQGLMTVALPAGATYARWWSCYVIDSEAA